MVESSCCVFDQMLLVCLPLRTECIDVNCRFHHLFRHSYNGWMKVVMLLDHLIVPHSTNNYHRLDCTMTVQNGFTFDQNCNEMLLRRLVQLAGLVMGFAVSTISSILPSSHFMQVLWLESSHVHLYLLRWHDLCLLY